MAKVTADFLLLGDEGMHIAELRAMALIKNEHDLLLRDSLHLILVSFVLQHRRQFLYRRDNELLLRVAAA